MSAVYHIAISVTQEHILGLNVAYVTMDQDPFLVKSYQKPCRDLKEIPFVGYVFSYVPVLSFCSAYNGYVTPYSSSIAFAVLSLISSLIFATNLGVLWLFHYLMSVNSLVQYLPLSPSLSLSEC